MTPTHAYCLAAVGLFVLLSGGPASAAPDPAALFVKKCSGCHTFGQGDRVGPDLKGVTDRRTRPWLRSWIQSSQGVLAKKDRIAVALFEKFKRERMPDQPLSDSDIAALLDYFAAGGPLAGVSRSRHAAAAQPSDIARGRDLFFGAQTAHNRSAPCVSCHSVEMPQAAGGGTFAKELTHVYSRFQDGALTEFLRRPCFPRAFAAQESAPLTEDEAFAVKAFLFSVDREAAGGRGGGRP
jgi:mono/diheme cytochrome c family protein